MVKSAGKGAAVTEKRETTGEMLNIGQMRFRFFTYGRPHTHDAPPTSSVRYIYIMEGALTFHVRNQEDICAQKHDIVYIPDGCHYVSDWEDDSHVFVADIGILDSVTSEHNYGDQVRILFHSPAKGIFRETVTHDSVRGKDLEFFHFRPL